MRLLINSHVKYWKPLSVLLSSLVDARFDRWSDVVLVFGGSRSDVLPRKLRLPIVPADVTVVNLTLNAFDYNGLSAIYHHRDHPLVRADSYFYLHDSATAGKNFTRLYGGFAAGIRPNELRKPKGAFSNICVFGRDLVNRWKASYDRNFTKAEAVKLEIGGVWYTARGARPLIYWARGHVSDLRERVGRGTLDVYHTGIPRLVKWYPDFDVYKYILGSRYGDITEGTTHPNFR